MNTQHMPGNAPIEDRFDHVEALLSRYPHLTGCEVKELREWFLNEASAFEVASLASKETLSEAYSQFRAEHIDRFGVRDAAILVGGLAFLIAAIAGLMQFG